jgi:hypothetical protein
MIAVTRLAVECKDIGYVEIVREFAGKIGEFVRIESETGKKRVCWKISDESRIEFKARDAYEGFTGFALMLVYLGDFGDFRDLLQRNVDLFEDMCQGENLITSDLAGIGDLFVFAKRIATVIQMSLRASGTLANEFEQVLRAGQKSLRIAIMENSEADANMKPEYRLPHKELQLIVGYLQIRKLQPLIDTLLKVFTGKQRKAKIKEMFDDLEKSEAYIYELKEFWMDEQNQNSSSWIQHKSRNMVLLSQISILDGQI